MLQSFKVSTTLASQRFVSHQTGTANSVEYPAAGNDLPIGITVDTVKDTTQMIPVAMNSEIRELLFDDTVNSGALVGSDSSGRGVPIADAATTTGLTILAAYGGILVGETVAATGTVANVLVMPGFVR